MDLVVYCLLFRFCSKELKTPKSKELQQIAMGTDSPKKFIPNPSQGDYWKGYMVEGGSGYNLIVAFLGILGLDKIALRAPLTAAFKLIVNIFTWGSWWMYDCIQTYGDKEFVAKYGYSTPFGPDGHGYNMISTMSSLEAAPLKPNNTGLLLYLLYVICCLVLPIGIGNMLAGDVTGGLAKLVSCMAFMTIPVYIIMGCIEFATSGTIEQEGVPRTFPIYPAFVLKDKHPATFILPKGTYNEETKTYAPHPQVTTYEKDLKRLVSEGKQPVFQAIVSFISKSLGDALNNWPPIAMFNTVSAAKDGIQAISKELSKNPKAALSVIGVNLPVIPKLPNVKLPEVPQDMAKLAAAAAGGAYQTGGSLAVYPEMDKLLIGGMVILVIGGLVAATIRKITFSNKTDDNEYPRKTYDRDDAPPVPGGV